MLHKDERSLVEKYQGQPFVILGVNNDPDPALLRDSEHRQHLTWRSWWDDGRVITHAWHIDGFPTLFLIDGTGKIRWKSVGKPTESEPRGKVEELVKEMR